MRIKMGKSAQTLEKKNIEEKVMIQDSTIYNKKKVSESEVQIKSHHPEEMFKVKPADEKQVNDDKPDNEDLGQFAEVKLGGNEQADEVKSKVAESKPDNQEQDGENKLHENETVSIHHDCNDQNVLFAKYNIKDCCVKLTKIKDEPHTNTKLSLMQQVTKSGLNYITCEYCNEEFSSFWKKKNHFLSVHQKELTCDICNNSFKSLKKLEIHKRIHTAEYQCRLCNKCFSRIDILDTHFLTKHIRIKPFKCKYCSKTFSVRVALLRHQRHHKKKNYSQTLRCTFCNRFFEKPLHLKKHIRLCHNEKKLVCKHCGARHNSLSSLKNHLLTHGGFDCNECGQTFLKKSYLKNHIFMQCQKEEKTQENDSPKKDDLIQKGVSHRCDICWKSFVTKKNCDRHVMKFHTDNKKYNCEECRLKFENEEQFKKHVHIKCKLCEGNFANIDLHMSEAHGADRPYKCNVCGIAFSAACFLRWHEKLHKNEFSCEYCFRQFGRSIFLESHILRKHVIERLFKCSLCLNKKYPSAELLKEHIKIMHTDGSFKCEYCEKVFNKFVFLERHVDQLHSIGKQLQCNFCPKKFATNNLLNEHEMFHLNSFECVSCGKIFKTNECLKEHVNVEHSIVNENNKMEIDSSIDLDCNIGHESINLDLPISTSYGTFYQDIDSLKKFCSDKTNDGNYEGNKPTSFECTCCIAVFFTHDALEEHIATEHTTFACSTHVDVTVKQNLNVKVKKEVDFGKNFEDYGMTQGTSSIDMVN